MNGDNNETQTRRNVPERQNAKKNKTRNPKKTKQKRNGRRRRRFPTSWRIVDDEIGLTRHRPLSTNKMSAKPKWVFFFFYRNSMKENKKKEGVAEERKVGLRRNSIFGGSFLLFFFSGLFFSSSICVCVCVCVNVGAVVNKNQNTFSDANYGTNYGTVIIALGPRWKNKRERKKERKKEERKRKKNRHTDVKRVATERRFFLFFFLFLLYLLLLLLLFLLLHLSLMSCRRFVVAVCFFCRWFLFVCFFSCEENGTERTSTIQPTMYNISIIDYRYTHSHPQTHADRDGCTHTHWHGRISILIYVYRLIVLQIARPGCTAIDLFFFSFFTGFCLILLGSFEVPSRSGFVRSFVFFFGSPVHEDLHLNFEGNEKIFTNQNKKN